MSKINTMLVPTLPGAKRAEIVLLSTNATEKNLNSLSGSFEKIFNGLQKSWEVNSTKAKEIVPRMPTEYRELFDLQQSINRCHLQTEIVTKVGDSVQSTLKKLQSQGG